MSSDFPSLVVAVAGQDRKRAKLLTQLGEKLGRCGLKTESLRSWRDTAISDCDILLIGCGDEDADSLVKQIEHFWTQKWNAWYAADRRRCADEV